MTSQIARVARVYRNRGLRGLFLVGVAKALQSSGTWLIHAANDLAIMSGAFLSPGMRHILERNQAFRDKHRGQRCFVIGNGPSLRTQDLGPLANEITFVMNAFWKHPILEQWQPTYYFLADPALFDGSEPMQRFFSDLGSRVHSTTFFVPLFAREVVRRTSLLPLDRTHFVAMRGRLKDGLADRPDFTRVVPGVMSVSQFAIMAAMYMGCSPIYLLGLDHDWLAYPGMDKHFYASKTIENHPQAHGDLSRISYKSELESVLELWCGYEGLLKCSLKEGIAILNATNGGFLDVFERVGYESLVEDRGIRCQGR